MVGQDPDRDPVEELAAEFAGRLRAGENPDIEEYARRHPDRADEVRELFPTVAVVERSKSRRPRTADGRASLGGPRPERLGNFRIVREIGRGGMGVVYEAVQESLGRPVAVKVLPRRTDPAERERFRLEARTAAKLHHTHVIPVFADGEQDGFCYFAMQLVTGVGLDEVIGYLARSPARQSPSGRPERFPLVESSARWLAATPGNEHWQRVAGLGVHVAEALHAAHTLGILHRDIKPANLLLDASGHVWVSDFGLANVRGPNPPGNSAELSGTPRYMAPEGLAGRADPRSDVYGLGVTLYELLTLSRAFPQSDQGELVRAITTGTITPPRSLCPNLPRDLDAIVRRATATDPDRRYSSASELAEDLRRFLDGRPVAARPVGPFGRAVRWGARNPVVAGLCGAVMLLLLTVAGVSAIGYVNTRRALEAESRERERAEETAVVALDALDKTFARLAPRRTGTALGAFGDRLADESYRPVVAPDTAAFLEGMLTSYDRLASQSGGNPTLRRATARANLRVGDINQRLGRFDAAVAAYRRALEIYRDLSPRATASDRSESALALNEIGLIVSLTRTPVDGRQSFREAVAVLEPYTSIPDATPQEQFELARSYYLLGRKGRPAGSGGGPGHPPPPRRPTEDDPIRKALAVTTALKDRYPAVPAYRHLLACCYRELAPGPLTEGGQAAVGLLEKLCEDFPGEPDYLLDLSEAYADFGGHRLTDPRKSAGDIERYLRKALAASERLTAAHPNVPEYTFSQGQIRIKLGTFLRPDRRAAAEEQVRLAVGLQAELVRRFPEVARYRVWLATYQGLHAELLADAGRWPEAIRLLDAAAAELEQLLAQDPDRRLARVTLTQTYTRLARGCEQAGLPDRAADARRRADLVRPPQPPGPP